MLSPVERTKLVAVVNQAYRASGFDFVIKAVAEYADRCS